MKKRTIEELHDRYVGHRKFAKICDLLIANGHTITNIREFNETFKYVIDGYELYYQKIGKHQQKIS